MKERRNFLSFQRKNPENRFSLGIFKKLIILDHDFIPLLKNPFVAIKQIKGELYREQPGRKTLAFSHKNKAYFIKIHTGVGWREIFKNLIQLRLPIVSAKTEWQALLALKALGIAAPIPVALGQQGINPAKRQSFIVTHAITHTTNLEVFFQTQPKITFAEKQSLIRTVAYIARTLHTNGINHRDFYLCHFLLEDGNVPLERRRVYLIDLHRTQLRYHTPYRWRLKDISGLYFSTMEFNFTQRDYYRFMCAYTGKSLRNTLVEDGVFWERVSNKAKDLFKLSKFNAN